MTRSMMTSARDIAFAMVVAAAAIAAPSAVHGQDGTLDRVQNLITTGRFTDAGTTLTRWEQEFSDPMSSASSADRARAMYLRALLTTDMAQGEELLMGVVLTYPSSAVAPDALLRLGQGLHTNGETQRAIAYLERLRTDYPGSEARPTGLLWLARAHLANGSAAAACETARAGASVTADPNLQLLLDIEQDRACGAAGIAVSANEPPQSTIERSSGVPPTATSGRAATSTPPVNSGPPVSNDPPVTADPPVSVNPPVRADPPAAAPPRTWETTAVAEAPPVTRPDTTGTPIGEPARQATTVSPPADVNAPPRVGDFAVQVAAYRDLRTARVIAGQMREAGVDVRIVTLRGSDDIYRIRSGSFVTAREAAAAMQHVRDAGFAALLVNDVPDERLVSDRSGL